MAEDLGSATGSSGRRGISGRLPGTLVESVLYTHPHPGTGHALAASGLGEELGPPFKRGTGGPRGRRRRAARALAAEALARAGTQPGRLVTMREDGESDGATSDAAAPAGDADAVTRERFNLHASVTVGAHDDALREGPCR